MPRTRSRAIGLARPITREEMRSYSRTLPNPLGVTAIALVNGRGAYSRSVRQVAHGKSQAARLRRAKQVLSKGNAMRRLTISKNIRSRLRRNAYSSATVAGPLMPGQTRSSLRIHVIKPKTFRKIQAKLKAGKPVSEREAKQVDTYLDALKHGNLPKYSKKRASRPRYKGPQTRKIAVRASRNVRVAFGSYRRARVHNPLSGRTEMSYMYVARGGKLRKIPLHAIVGAPTRGKAFDKLPAARQAAIKAQLDKITARRVKAANRVTLHGGVFVPNKKRRRKAKRNSTMQANFRKGSRLSAAMRKKIARGVRKSYRLRGLTKKRTSRKTRRTRKSTVRKASVRRLGRDSKGRFLKRGAKKRTTKRGHKRVARRGRKHSSRAYFPNMTEFVMNGRRKGRKGHRRGRKHTSLSAILGLRKHRKGHRKSRRTHRNAFMSDLTAVLKTGLVVGAGFLVHRLVTNLLVDYVVEPQVVSKITDANTKKYVKAAEKTLVGLLVLGGGVLASSALPKLRMELGAGMVASIVQQLLIDALTVANQATAAKEISGYSTSLAYSLHGAYEHNAVSLMPGYTPVNGYGEYFAPTAGMGAFQQAAAGTGEYFQAAAGMGATFQQAAAGTGEYFAPAGLKGIGQYEGAGEEALLPSGAPTVITDGIRPDSNLDRELDLMEAAAGLHGRRGTGEYITAQRRGGGGYTEAIVGQQSQWIPNGPMWAGTLDAADSAATSEIPAGILATQGGNGSLSA